MRTRSQARLKAIRSFVNKRLDKRNARYDYTIARDIARANTDSYMLYWHNIRYLVLSPMITP